MADGERLPVRADPDRPVWLLLRDLCATAQDDAGHRRPAVLDTAAASPLPDDHRVTLALTGQQFGTQRAVVTTAVREELRIPLAALRETPTARAVVQAADATMSGLAALGQLAYNCAVVAGALDDTRAGRRDRATEQAQHELAPLFTDWLAAIDPAAVTTPPAWDLAPAPLAGWYRTARTYLHELGDQILDEWRVHPFSATWSRTTATGKTITLHHAQRWFRDALRTAFPAASTPDTASTDRT